MELEPSDKKKNLPTPIWDTYQSILDEAEKSKVQYSGVILLYIYIFKDTTHVHYIGEDT